MGIEKAIDALILELSRKGLKPKYIVVGRNQYMRWMQEAGKSHIDDIENKYLGYDLVICSSDIIEVVPEFKELVSYYLKVKL